MRKTMKKALALTLTLCMLVTLLPSIALPALAAEGDEARVGSTYYATLQAAIAAVPYGGTVTLLRNITVANDTYIDLAVPYRNFGSVDEYTLDLGNYTISGNVNQGLLLTIYKGLTVNITAAAGGGVTNANTGEESFAIRASHLLNINGGTYTGGYGAIHSNSSASVTVINAGVFNCGARLFRGNVTVAFGSTASPAADSWNTAKNVTVTIDGGTVPSGEARIGGRYYATLQAAIAAVGQNETVTLLKNIKDSPIIYLDSTPGRTTRYTLDLNNYSITGSQSYIFYFGNGHARTVTLKAGVADSTVRNNKAHAIEVYSAGATIYIDGGEYIGETFGMRVSGGRAVIVEGLFVGNTRRALEEAGGSNGGTINIAPGSVANYNKPEWNTTTFVSVTRKATASEADPIIISTAEELAALAARVNEKVEPSGQYYMLAADIDLTVWLVANSPDNGWIPIGYEPDCNFNGSLNGNGYTISGLWMDGRDAAFSKKYQYVGLFGVIGIGGEVKNLNVTFNAPVCDGPLRLGALAARNVGTITNCHTRGVLKSSSIVGDAGGLVGTNGGTIEDCSSSVNIVAGGRGEIGGLVGLNFGTITRCYATGAVTSPDAYRIGGLVGLSGDGEIVNCYATGAVTGGELAGALVGENESGRNANFADYSTIKNCYATGAVTGGKKYMGGLVGKNATLIATNIAASYFDKTTTGRSSGVASGDTKNADIAGKKTSDMMKKSTYKNWDFVNTWTIAEGSGYPKLKKPVATLSGAVVDIPAPVLGRTPGTASLSTDGLTLAHQSWINKTTGGAVTTFQPGNTYRCFVIVTPNNNYSFMDYPIITGNNDAPSEYLSRNANIVSAFYDFDFKNPTINIVAVTVPAPKAGELPQNAVSGTTGVKVSSTTWLVVSGDGSTTPHTGPFKANTTYRCAVTVEPVSEAYAISPEASATINTYGTVKDTSQPDSVGFYYNFSSSKATITLTGIGWVGQTKLTFNGKPQTVGAVVSTIPDGVTGIRYSGTATETWVGTYSIMADPIYDSSFYNVVGYFIPQPWSINPIQPKLATVYGVANPYRLSAGSSVELNTLITGQHLSQNCSYSIEGDTISGTTLSGNTLSAASGAPASAVTKITVSVDALNLGGSDSPEYLASTDPIDIYVQIISKTPVPGFAVSMEDWVYKMDPAASLPEPDVTLPDGFSMSNVKITYTGTLRADGKAYEDPDVKPRNTGSYFVTAVYEDGTYYSSATDSFTIEPKDISEFAVKGETFTYDGTTKEAFPELIFGDYVFVYGDHYVSDGGSGAVGVGTYQVVVYGIGNYCGACYGTYNIVPKALKTPTEPMVIEATAEDRAYLPGNKAVEIDSVTFDGYTSDTEFDLPVLGVELVAVGTMETADVGTNKDVEVTLYLTKSNHLFADGTKTATVMTTVTISEAEAPVLPNVNVYHRYGESGTKTVSIAGLLPAGAETAEGTAHGVTSIISAWSVDDGTLSYTLAGGAIDDVITLPVIVTTPNYKDATVDVVITLTDKVAPTLTVRDIVKTYDGAPVTFSDIAGTATFNGEAVEGDWSFVGTPPTNVADSGSFDVTFTPANEDSYAAKTVSIVITINKAWPDGTPSFTPITEDGKTLYDVPLDGRGILGVDGSSTLEGTSAWDDGPDMSVSVNTDYDWKFTPNPTDAANYHSLTGSFVPYERDDIAPTISDDGTTEISRTGATLNFDTDEEGDYYYLVYAAANAAPDVTAIKAQGTAAAKGNDFANIGANAVAITRLAASTAYKAYIIVEDEAGNVSNVLEIAFTTSATESGSIPGTNGGTVNAPKSDEDEWKNPFIDVNKNHWFYGDVKYVHQKGLFNGTSANTFSPQMPMTRGMVVTVLGRLAGIDIADYAGKSFDDVDTKMYYAPYVKWAAEKGIVYGIGDNKFAPDADVTREQLAAILYRYAEVMGITLPEITTAAIFDDDANISGYAKEAVAAMQKAAIINGKPGNIFDPQGNATRAEVAAMLHRLCEIVK